MIDILLPLGSGSRSGNAELRFALRSIERYATGWNRVVIVGESPVWLKPGPRLKIGRCREANGNKEFRIASKIGWAFTFLDITDDVAFWNDDFVLTAPVDVRFIPPYQKGQLVTEARKLEPMTPYRKVLENTESALRRANRPTLHYDLHCPIIYNREKFLSLNNWWSASRVYDQGFAVKSTYSNLTLPEPGPWGVDCKLHEAPDAAHINSRVAGRWVFSYGDGAFRGSLRGYLQTAFPSPCSLEKTPSG